VLSCCIECSHGEDIDKSTLVLMGEERILIRCS
jgi:hypothetical protein